MARPSKSAPIDYKGTNDLTHGLLERAACPDGLPFVLVRDADKKGLRLRVTKAGGKHWQFETRIKGKLFTRALGEWPAVSIDDAKTEAHRLRGLTEQGTDPREKERQQQAEKVAASAAAKSEAIAATLTFGEAWSAYVADRKPYWGDWQYQDQLTLGDAGGLKPKRGKPNTLTRARPLHKLMGMRLVDVTSEVVEDWAATEAKTRKSVSRRAHSCLKTFFSWCMEQRQYKHLVTTNPAKTKRAKEVFGTPSVRADVLQREQLPLWFAHVRQIQNPVISAYLQCLLLTGARREELGELKWADVNFQWRGLDLKDKIQGRRAVPLTPFVRSLIEGLPRRNEWVFSSVTAISADPKHAERRARYHAKAKSIAPVGDVSQRSKSGRLVEPSIAHRKACTAAGLDGLTLHGLRRSFASLCEWLDIPGGISAQIQGHAPQGVREQNYIRRPLDLLRVHHEKIEAWMLEQAGIVFDPNAEPGALQLVKS
jgi:integrase